MRAPNGSTFPGGVRSEIAHLVEGMVREFHERGYHAKDGWCWGYAYRKIRGSSTAWSNHAWGLAIDFNAPDHPLGKRGTGVPAWADEIAARWGFFWGGNYSGRADEMHYEFLGTPSDVARYPLGGTEEDSDDMNADQDKVLRDTFNAATQARDTVHRLSERVAKLESAVIDGSGVSVVERARQTLRLARVAAGGSIRAVYDRYGVVVPTDDETAPERIGRNVGEVEEGKRTAADLEASIVAIAEAE